MAKYDITYSCGHTGTIELFGKDSDRHRKIEYLEEKGLCPECYKASLKDCNRTKPEGYEEVRIHYADYKNTPMYAGLRTKTDSYDKTTKTIVVFVPVAKVAGEILRKAAAELGKPNTADEMNAIIARTFEILEASEKVLTKDETKAFLEEKKAEHDNMEKRQ